MEKIIQALKQTEPGQMVTMASFMSVEGTETEVMILGKRENKDGVMLDVDVSLFGVHMFKATLKVTDKVTMFVEKEAA